MGMLFTSTGDGNLMVSDATEQDKAQIIDVIEKSFEGVPLEERQGYTHRDVIVDKVNVSFAQMNESQALVCKAEKDKEIKAIMICRLLREGRDTYAHIDLIAERERDKGYGGSLEEQVSIFMTGHYLLFKGMEVKQEPHTREFFEKRGYEAQHDDQILFKYTMG